MFEEVSLQKYANKLGGVLINLMFESFSVVIFVFIVVMLVFLLYKFEDEG